jgi:hypothetical protein
MDVGPINKRIAERLGGRLAGDDILVNRDGIRLSVRLSLGKATYTLAIECSLLPDASWPAGHPRVQGRPRLGLWLEGGTERLGKRLSLNLEAETGDTEFDRKVYIHSHAPIPVVSQVLAAPETRAAVLGLLEADWHKLVIDARGGRIAVRGRADAKLVGTFPERVEQAIGHLVRLARALPAFEGSKFWRTRVVDVAAPLAGLLTLVTGALLVTWGAHDYPVDDTGHAFTAAGYGLALWPAVGLLVFLLARKGAEGLSTWFSCMLTMLLGLPLSGAGAMLVVNGRYDHGMAAIHEVEIVRKDTSRGSKKTYYHLYMRDWHTPPKPEGLEMQVDREVYESAQIGGSVHLDIMPGRLGYPWLHSFEVLPPAPPAPSLPAAAPAAP